MFFTLTFQLKIISLRLYLLFDDAWFKKLCSIVFAVCASWFHANDMILLLGRFAFLVVCGSLMVLHEKYAKAAKEPWRRIGLKVPHHRGGPPPP